MESKRRADADFGKRPSESIRKIKDYSGRNLTMRGSKY